MIHAWLDSWSGLGLITDGMQRQGWDVQLTAHGNGHWRATFWVTGLARSITGGSAYESTPWRAVQKAAYEAISRPAAAQRFTDR